MSSPVSVFVPWRVTIALLGAGLLMVTMIYGPRVNLPVLARPELEQDVLRIAYVQALVVDPHGWTKPLPAQNQLILSLWEPLIECDPETGAPLSAAAVSWAWSPDRLTLTLTLRNDGRWSNGDRVTAQDFVRGWRRLIDLRTERSGVLLPVKNALQIQNGEMDDPAALGVSALDDLTLQIQLVEPRTSFVAELADPLLVPLHASSVEVLDECSFIPDPAKLVSNGAFQLVRARPREGCRLAVSPYYRDRISVLLDGVEFLRVDNVSMGQMLVAVGRADVVTLSDDGALLDLPTNRGVKTEEEQAMLVSALNLNLSRGPLQDVRVRRALALAVDRAAFIAELGSDFIQPAYGWVPTMPGRPALTIMGENADEARRLLADAGYPGGQNFPVLIMALNPRQDRYEDWLSWTERWYRELGVRTYLTYDNLERAKQRITEGEYDVAPSALIATVPDPTDMLMGFAHPEICAMPSWRNKNWTRRLHEANRETGSRRAALLESYERDVLGDVPAIPTMFTSRRTLLGAEVIGWYADPLGRQALKRLAIRRLDQEASNEEG